jgi:hypothetical protein
MKKEIAVTRRALALRASGALHPYDHVPDADARHHLHEGIQAEAEEGKALVRDPEKNRHQALGHVVENGGDRQG